MDSEKEKQQIERELITIILKLDEYRGDIQRCRDEMLYYERLIDEAENLRDGLIGDWYNAN